MTQGRLAPTVPSAACTSMVMRIRVWMPPLAGDDLDEFGATRRREPTGTAAGKRTVSVP